jgi:hypothetical protein
MTDTVPVQAPDERGDFVFLSVWGYVLPVLAFWIALWASTYIPSRGHTDAPGVFPYQFHVAAAVLVPLLNGWVFLPKFRSRASVALAGFAIPVAVFLVLTWV